jgi:hypothetical protein
MSLPPWVERPIQLKLIFLQGIPRYELGIDGFSVQNCGDNDFSRVFV